MIRQWMPAMLVIVISGWFSAIAQSPAEVPSAVVLVKPMGQQAMLAITYSKVVRHEDVKRAVSRIADGLGVRVLSFSASDVAPPGDSTSKETGGEAILSGLGELVSDRPLLQPILEAMVDQKLFELFLMVPRKDTYTGLRSFSSPSVSVDLLRDTGAYRFRFRVHQSGSPIPTLPREQALTAAKPIEPAKPQPFASNAGWVLVITSLAGLSALAVFVTLRNRRNRANTSFRGAPGTVIINPSRTAPGRKEP